MSVDDLLNKLDELLDSSWSLPLSGGRCVLDAERVREIIDEVRLNLPAEVRQARAIVSDRSDIIKSAREEAASIVQTARQKANAMVTDDEITKQAKDKANEIVAQANRQSKEIRVAAANFVDNLIRNCEQSLTGSLNDLRNTRQALHQTGHKPKSDG